MPNEGEDKTAVPVETVLREEKEKHVRPKKSKELGAWIQSLKRSPGTPVASQMEAIGGSALCLSGGGIRSATVALGFLQACDNQSFLKKCDYLFTVSGGGYIGGWLTALMYRLRDHENPKVGIDEDQGALHPEEPGAQAVANLRRYSNYLTPRLGLFSGDSLALVAIYLRNLFLNGLMLLSLLGAVTVLPKILYRLFRSQTIAFLWASPWTCVLSGILALVAGAYTVFAGGGSKLDVPPDSTAIQPNEKTSAPPPGKVKRLLEKLKGHLSTDSFIIFKVFPLLGSLLLLSGFLYRQIRVHPKEVEQSGWIGLWCAALCVAFLFCWGLGRRVLVHSGPEDKLGAAMPGLLRPAPEAHEGTKTLCNVVQIVGAYAIGSIAFIHVVHFPHRPLFFLICVPPGLLAIYLVGVALFAGFVNPILSDDDREWWARSSGYLIFAALLWLLIGGLSLCADVFPFILNWLGQKVGAADLVAKLSGVNWATVTTTVSGLLALLTRESNVVRPGGKKTVPQRIGALMFKIACPVFIVALILSLSISESAIAHTTPHVGWCYLAICLTLSLMMVMLSCVVNVNKFSLHNTYRNRLIRTFLGASHQERKPNPFTGFDEDDNVFLKDIDEEQRPYHVLCGTVNLYARADLAWQERRAALFTFAGDHCGVDFLRFRPTAEYGGPLGISLGTAMAISGAAANPNMGFYSSPDRAFVMTLLNVRLGWWLGNPKFQKPWRREGPFPAIKPLVAEMLLLTRETSSFINISDGGHFDDTGVYEAVRRRCSTIFLVDVNTTHENVARMIRKVRIDFGVDITLQHDFAEERGIPAQIYQIEYPRCDSDPKLRSGVLIRVYPALAPKSFRERLPADVLNFAQGDSAFPADQLGNQWYGEAQFESYRKLGRQIGMDLFADKLVKPVLEALEPPLPTPIEEPLKSEELKR